jgi:hypothetical protein
MKITAINIKIPKETTLPDGIYTGIWGGYIINIYYNEKYYELTTEEGVRGTGFKVVVTIKNGIATFESIKN